MKIGNVPSGKANFTLPPPRWVVPVSRRLRCCNKSSGRLVTHVRAAVGSHPHMVPHASGGPCLPRWGSPAGFKLLLHKHPFSAACCGSARSHCESGWRWALIILFHVFFSSSLSLSLFIAVQEDFHTTEFPSAVFSAVVCLKEKKHSLAVSEVSAVFAFWNFWWLRQRIWKSEIFHLTVALFCLVSKRTYKTVYLALSLTSVIS